MIVELKNNITSETIKKYSFKFDNLFWSNSKYCNDSKKAKEAEDKFLKSDAKSDIILDKVIRPTANGFFASIYYKTNTEELNSIVVYLSLWMCKLDYKPSLFYTGGEESVSNFFNSYRSKAPSEVDAAGTDLAKNIQAIETNIPLPTGEFKSGGPRRAAIFYLNYELEHEIVTAANNKKLAGLEIDQLNFADSTHDTFHQGAGTTAADLTDGKFTYEVKGPLTNITELNVNVNKNKAADFILRLANNKLTRYKRTETGYEKVAEIDFNFEYEDLLAGIKNSWEDYWAEK